MGTNDINTMISIREYAAVIKQRFNSAGFYTSDLSHNYAETSFEIEKEDESLICTLLLNGRIIFKETYFGIHTKFESSINCPVDLLLEELEAYFGRYKRVH